MTRCKKKIYSLFCAVSIPRYCCKRIDNITVKKTASLEKIFSNVMLIVFVSAVIQEKKPIKIHLKKLEFFQIPLNIKSEGKKDYKRKFVLSLVP